MGAPSKYEQSSQQETNPLHTITKKHAEYAQVSQEEINKLLGIYIKAWAYFKEKNQDLTIPEFLKKCEESLKPKLNQEQKLPKDSISCVFQTVAAKFTYKFSPEISRHTRDALRTDNRKVACMSL